MAVEEIQTTNYNIPKYISTDAPNLLDQYNAAMDVIDGELLTVNQENVTQDVAITNASNLATTANTAVNNLSQHVNDLDTTLSNEIATVNANLIAQQVNTSYTEYVLPTQEVDANFPKTSYTVYISSNMSYFFVTGQAELNANQTYNLVEVPGQTGTTIAKGIRLTQTPIFPTSATAKIYNNVLIDFRNTTGVQLSNGTTATIGGVSGGRALAIGSDGHLYLVITTGSNTTLTTTQAFYQLAIQTKLTLTQLDIPIHPTQVD